MPKSERNPKSETRFDRRNGARIGLRCSPFGFRISGFFRISDFGLRICPDGPAGWNRMLPWPTGPLALLLLTIGGASFDAVAASPGDEVIVVYNSRLPESKQVAEHYAARRQVPGHQVVGLELPVTETMTRA